MTVMISKARILRMIDNCSCCIHNQYDARQFGLLNQQYQHGGTTLSIHRCVLSVTHLELTQISSRTTWRRYASHEANHFYKRYITMTNWYIYIYITQSQPFSFKMYYNYQHAYRRLGSYKWIWHLKEKGEHSDILWIHHPNKEVISTKPSSSKHPTLHKQESPLKLSPVFATSFNNFIILFYSPINQINSSKT